MIPPDPCPFCGSTEVEAVPRDFCARVVCNNPYCGAVGPFSFRLSGPEWQRVTSESAINKWNDRAQRVRVK